MDNRAQSASGESALQDLRSLAGRLEAAVQSVVIGQDAVVRLMVIALLARGHVLLEGDVGIGKTTLLRAFARAVGGGYARIEGSVDLMPGDLLYHSYLTADGRPQVAPGPLLEHGENLSVFFFNEINRARPQVQALLLRAMAERSIGAFNAEHRLPHLTVFADRNRVERGETFELAAAARDRFLFEIGMQAPPGDTERTRLLFDPVFHDSDALVDTLTPGLLDYRLLAGHARAIQQAIAAPAVVERYALDLMRATAEPVRFGIALDGVEMPALILSGASPRGMSLVLRAARVHAFLAGRTHLEPEDLRAVFAAAVAHRLVLGQVYEFERQTLAPAFVAQLLKRVAAP